jgi:hypothetical protein
MIITEEHIKEYRKVFPLYAGFLSDEQIKQLLGMCKDNDTSSVPLAIKQDVSVERVSIEYLEVLGIQLRNRQEIREAKKKNKFRK